MVNNEEVIDVEEYHRDRQRESEDSWKRRYYGLKEGNKALETELGTISRANSALHRQVFEHNQRQCRVAQLLGFDDFDSMEAKITSKDPWVPDARSRILRLEEQVAKHALESEREAKVLHADMEELLADAQDEALRLRKERDFARCEAERQAADARMFRAELQRCRDELLILKNELNTTLPEMQALDWGRHTKVITQSSHPDEEKENVPAQRPEHCITPLCDIENTSCSPNNKGNAVPDSGCEAQCHKEKYELLEARYNELLAAKKEVSRRYFEDLQKWKDFKEWLVRTRLHNGNVKRHVLRKRKATEEAGVKDIPPGSNLEKTSVRVTLDHGPAEIPDATLDPITKNDVFVVQESLLPPLPHHMLHIGPLGPLPSQESLTQQSLSPTSPPFPEASTMNKPSAQIAVSQESTTQPSSALPSPVHEHVVTGVRESEGLQPLLRATNSPQPRTPVVQASERRPREYASGKTERGIQSTIYKSQQDDDPRADDRRNFCLSLSPERERPITGIPTSVLLDATRPTNFNDAETHFAKPGMRRASTVLALDTPPRVGASIHKHSSSHVLCLQSSPSAVRNGKRKAEDAQEGADHSDPFAASSGSQGTSVIFRTREQKTAHGKMLGKQSHARYMNKYMRYKGRGRYSAARVVPDQTVNAEFEIDPTRNGGVEYQFDAVVRDKAVRKGLEAGDCECCRDYYDAIGPLPPRLQRPKWISPSRSHDECPSRPCRHQAEDSRNDAPVESTSNTRAKDIESHKREISRHRHNWAPPITPPRYWDIGFPDTQEVADINRRANDMHTRKLQRIKAEANSGSGKYRSRE